MREADKGKLFLPLDESGEFHEPCILIEMHKQFSLPHDVVEHHRLRSNRWHYEVLVKGSIKFLDTDHWTLISVENYNSVE
jgi:hypothetical protein